MISPPIATSGRSIYPAIAALADIPRWVCWKPEDHNGKPTKVPYCVGGRRKAKSTDPRTWDTFDPCWTSAFHDGRAAGIGIVLDGSDDLMAADLDHCIFDSGEIAPWAKIVVRKLASYTERSPSGTGLRVFFRSPHDAVNWGTDEKGDPKQGRTIKFQGGHLELYRGKRFLTVTGAHHEMTPTTIELVSPEVVAELLGPPRTEADQNEPNPHPAEEVPDELTDKLNEAMAEDARLWEAWNGQAPAGSDTTRSAYDLRLAGALRRHGGFTLDDFATLARWWPHGKGADGDPRHWRRTWDKAQPPKPDEDLEQLGEVVRAQIISWPALSGRKAPAREFILQDWIPARSVTLLHGFGGVGKSLIAQQIGTAAAFQREFLGAICAACPVLAWWGEDDHDEIWRRQENIDAAIGIGSIADLEGKLFWRPCPGDDITLFTAANESNFATTPNFRVLREQVMDLGIKLAILDSATQIAAIPENNRPLVTRCLQALTKLCLDASMTTVLIGHNNREGDYSGSSAWENRARSRVHMKRAKNDDGSETITLARPKANYAVLEQGVSLEWHQGAYRCTDHRFETFCDRLNRECREREIDQAFLAALDRLTEQRRSTSASKQASNYAPKVMVQNSLADPFTKAELERAMIRLFNDGRILGEERLWRRDNRAWITGLGRKT